MDIDLCIKRVDAVYYVCTDSWKRDFYAPRLKDGFVLVLEGMNRYTFPSEQVFARKNDIVILPKSIPYSGLSYSDGKFKGIVIDFECTEGTSFAQLGFPYVISVTDKKYYNTLFKEIVEVWENRYADANIHIKSLIYKLVYKLFREVNEVSNEKIPVILEYINGNLEDRNLSVTSLCQKFFISESTLMRGIHKATGCTTNVYINLQRLEKAREHILTGGKSVKEISILCGFSSPYYFSNLFKKKYGCSPRNYKYMLRENNGGNKFN